MSGAPQVLVVEGTIDDGVADQLENAGLSVRTVPDLEAATAELSTGAFEFDCVVSPVEVPEGGGEAVGGVEVLRAVLDADPDLPVVLVGDPGESAGEPVAAGVADYVTPDGEGAIDRLVGRVRNAVARRQAVRRAERQARINEVIREVNQALVRASSRTEIERAVCERLAGAEQYVLAWIADVDEEVSLRAMGVEGAAIEGGATSVSGDTAYTEPVREAARTREPVVVRDVEAGVWEAALDRTPAAVAAVPVVYEDRPYGVLVVYADRPEAFDGEERRILAEVGDNVAYAMNAVDVRRTMRLRERELRRQNERLEEFASVVSHDLRNPLNVARGYLEMLDGDAADQVESSLDRMEAIIEDVLELARQGRTVGEPEPVDLAAAARRAWDNVDTGEAALEVGPVGTVAADEGRLTSLLENLFRNAREHGDAGVVTVGDLDDGFFVADDGTGLTEEAREQAFEMGFTTRRDGTGFGLAIVEQVAAAHGWRVRATESADGGARFEVTGLDRAGAEAEGPPPAG